MGPEPQGTWPGRFRTTSESWEGLPRAAERGLFPKRRRGHPPARPEPGPNGAEGLRRAHGGGRSPALESVRASELWALWVGPELVPTPRSSPHHLLPLNTRAPSSPRVPHVGMRPGKRSENVLTTYQQPKSGTTSNMHSKHRGILLKTKEMSIT